MKYILIATLSIGILFSACNTSENSDRKLIKKEVKKYLKKSIKNPRSYEEVDFEIFFINEANGSKYLVKHEYKAKDGIGTLRNEIDCFIYTKQEEVLLKDPNCQAYKRLYKKLTE